MLPAVMDIAPPAPLRPLCALDDLPAGESRGFTGAGADPALFAVRDQAGAVQVYVNACPHLGVPLDWQPGRFLSADGSVIVCATHGAEFRLSDGLCLRGPCRGETLTKVPYDVRDGMIMVPARADRPDAAQTQETDGGNA